MFASILPFIKIIAPVASIIGACGGICLISSAIPEYDATKPLAGIYLLVKTSDDAQSTAIKNLTSTTGTKTAKNYFCQIPNIGTTTKDDKTCALFNINTPSGIYTTDKSSSPQSAATLSPKLLDSIDFHPNTFKPHNLTTIKELIKPGSHHILRVSKEFYKTLAKQTTSENKKIKLLDSNDTTKTFGSVQEVINLNLNTEQDLVDPISNLFVARITNPTSSLSGSATQPFSCQINKETSIRCKVYTLQETDSKNNNLDKTQLSNLTEVSTLSDTDFALNNYVVVDLLGNLPRSSELKNKTITINHKAEGSTKYTKIAETQFDQLLIGKVGTPPSSSAIFPLTPKKAAFLVEKIPSDKTTFFTGIKGGSTKNYKCSFEWDNYKNIDNSCILQSFPLFPKGHSYAALTTKSTSGFSEISSIDSNKDQYLLTFDAHKLFNLRGSWYKDLLSNLEVVVTNEANSSTTSFKLLQELRLNKAIGKTDLVLTKYSDESVDGNLDTTGKCTFTKAAKTGIDCSIHKATMKRNTPNSFAHNVASTPLAKDDYFAIKFTDYKNMNDFNGKDIYFFTTNNNKKVKIPLRIVSTIGGNITPGKAFYFLESPRISLIPPLPSI